MRGQPVALGGIGVEHLDELVEESVRVRARLARVGAERIGEGALVEDPGVLREEAEQKP